MINPGPGFQLHKGHGFPPGNPVERSTDVLGDDPPGAFGDGCHLESGGVAQDKEGQAIFIQPGVIAHGLNVGEKELRVGSAGLEAQSRWVESASTRIAEKRARDGVTVAEYSLSGPTG